MHGVLVGVGLGERDIVLVVEGVLDSEAVLDGVGVAVAVEVSDEVLVVEGGEVGEGDTEGQWGITF